MGQCRRRSPHPNRQPDSGLHRDRAVRVQPLQPRRPSPGPVQPGIPGRRQRRSLRLCRRPVLFQRACPRRCRDPELEGRGRNRRSAVPDRGDRRDLRRHPLLHREHPVVRRRSGQRLLDRPCLTGQVEELCGLWPADLERDRLAPPDGRRALHQGHQEGRLAVFPQRQLPDQSVGRGGERLSAPRPQVGPLQSDGDDCV